MRWTSMCCLVLLAACGDDESTVIDAPPIDAADIDAAEIDAVAIDAPIDATEIDACATRVVFAGGMDPVAQGWSVVQSGSAVVTAIAPDVTELRTTTVGGNGAHLLLSLPGAVTPGMPFIVEVELQVEAVAAHNQYDAAVAIMGSFTPSFGTSAERMQMLYVDPGGIGWADDTASAAANSLDGAFHTYRLAVDAAGTATVARDGQPLLTRPGFTTNGTIAIGDQTNDDNLEAVTRLRSVSLLCP